MSAYLILENGEVFEGMPFGSEAETVGELVFNTDMVGYLELVTDPSLHGQIVVQSFPQIGNYGEIKDNYESASPQLNGYIVSEWCQIPSNFRNEGNFDTFLKRCKIPGITGLDTRRLVKTIRDCGTMNAIITYSPVLTDEQKNKLK